MRHLQLHFKNSSEQWLPDPTHSEMQPLPPDLSPPVVLVHPQSAGE